MSEAEGDQVQDAAEGPDDLAGEVVTPASEEGDGAQGGRTYAQARGDWKGRFIEALQIMPNIRAACDLAGVARSTVYKAKGVDATFSAAWDTAIEESVDRLEQAVWERATVGFQRIRRTYHKDGKLATESIEDVFSDRLAELLLKAHRPDKYIERLRLGREPEDAELDSEILAFARELAEVARGAQARALGAGEQIEEAEVIETTVVETTRGTDDG